jgi:hypothetical protein
LSAKQRNETRPLARTPGTDIRLAISIRSRI